MPGASDNWGREHLLEVSEVSDAQATDFSQDVLYVAVIGGLCADFHFCTFLTGPLQSPETSEVVWANQLAAPSGRQQSLSP